MHTHTYEYALSIDMAVSNLVLFLTELIATEHPGQCVIVQLTCDDLGLSTLMFLKSTGCRDVCGLVCMRVRVCLMCTFTLKEETTLTLNAIIIGPPETSRPFWYMSVCLYNFFLHMKDQN